MKSLSSLVAIFYSAVYIQNIHNYIIEKQEKKLVLYR